MASQPKYKPLQASAFFADGRSSRPLVPGTIPRGRLGERDEYSPIATGSNGAPMPDPLRPTDPNMSTYRTTFPFRVTRPVLERGRERYDIFCAVCHDRLGTGQGMIVQRGFPRPPTYHSDRLRNAPVGYLFEVITRGHGAMPEHAAQIPPRDRYAIVAYLRVLQLSQNATPVDVPVGEVIGER
jgi:hypothetical protein